jgi:2-hydroxycyclohexanecarboxyl-CoA dehydrogenase
MGEGMQGLSLQGRVAVVTGGAGGIGSQICDDLASLAARVVVADVQETDARSVADRLPNAVPIGVDLADEESVDTFATRCRETVGAVDILVGCAAITLLERFVESDKREWDRHWKINLRANMQLSHAFLPAMIDREWGRLVFISSDGARAGSSGEVVYSAAKAGLMGLAKSLAREVARYGVTSNVVCPGVTDTPNTRRHQQENPRLHDALVKRIPARRMGTPAEISAMVAFLCTERAAYVTGQTISVNGGIAMY